MNVLIADDDRLVLETLRRYVQYRGDKAFVASDGSMALRFIETETFDLVITDIQMPDLSGFELLKAVKAKSPEVPVIIITGFADMTLAVKAVNQGAFAFLPKPILFTDLNDKIEEAIAALQSHRDVQHELKTLHQTTVNQKQQIEQARALSALMFNTISFPVCVIDSDRRIQLANPAFREQVAVHGMNIENQLLEEVVPTLNFHPFVYQDIFEVFRDPQNSAGFTLAFESPQGNDVSFFQVTGFAIEQGELVDVEIDRPLTCLFMRDDTLRVRHDEEMAERQWVTSTISDFRELTNQLVVASDFSDQVVSHLCQLFAHFNVVSIEMVYKGQVYAQGTPSKNHAPYLMRPLLLGEQEVGHISLFCDAPERLYVQQVLIDDLVDVLMRRIEVHEFQLGVVQSERLRSLGEMAAGVAHELNQPLTGIRTFAEGLLYGMKLGWDLSDDQLKETLNDIVQQVDRASGIIDYMRDFSRRQMGDHKVQFAIADVIKNVLKLVSAQLQVHDIRLVTHLDPDLPLCSGRPRQIEQIVLNLLANARHAIDKRLHNVSAKKDDWQPEIVIRAEVEDSGMKVSVADTGGGIPQEIVDRIFEPFFTSKEVGEGTGLGLSISRNIAQAHGGDLWVVNRPGEGATFYLTLLFDQKEKGLGKKKRGTNT